MKNMRLMIKLQDVFLHDSVDTLVVDYLDEQIRFRDAANEEMFVSKGSTLKMPFCNHQLITTKRKI